MGIADGMPFLARLHEMLESISGETEDYEELRAKLMEEYGAEIYAQYKNEVELAIQEHESGAHNQSMTSWASTTTVMTTFGDDDEEEVCLDLIYFVYILFCFSLVLFFFSE